MPTNASLHHTNVCFPSTICCILEDILGLPKATPESVITGAMWCLHTEWLCRNSTICQGAASRGPSLTEAGYQALSAAEGAAVAGRDIAPAEWTHKLVTSSWGTDTEVLVLGKGGSSDPWYALTSWDMGAFCQHGRPVNILTLRTRVCHSLCFLQHLSVLGSGGVMINTSVRRVNDLLKVKANF